jgi:hypothetical protein
MRLLRFAICVVAAALLPAHGAGRDRYICGLNHAGITWEEWVRSGNVHFQPAPMSDRSTLAELQRVSGTNYKPDERTDLGLPPAIWLIRGAENAFAGTSAEGDSERTTKILLDDSWIDGMERELSNPWVRKTVIAHELGHLAHGDVWGEGAATVWKREYNADVFAGFAMCKLGAPEESARDVYRKISWDRKSEDPDSHPSRVFRLRAIAEGYGQAGCR